LRRYLTKRWFTSQAMRASGLVDERGRDSLFRCLTFPLKPAGTLYARSLSNGIYRHRFLLGSKGGLYGWAQRLGSPRVLLVEGLFDVAALWQAGFDDAVAALGSHLNQFQMVELCLPDAPRIYICFDADRNGSGQRAARSLSIQPRHARLEALRVDLPEGHAPASFFAASGNAGDFQRCLEGAHP